MKPRLGQTARIGLFLLALFYAVALAPMVSLAAPYAAMVIDARTGKVLHSRNADTKLYPASLTKMMTLYIVFEAVEHGEISLDTMVTISANAAAQPPSKLGLKAGQKIKLRYLIRAAAIKSANDAAMALAEAIEGSQSAFAARMNRTAKALGMTRSHFINPHGLTVQGHYSTARDMTTMGRHLLYDWPQYYNLFSRRTADAGIRTVNNTNRRFLDSYSGADGIKTGYTAAAGFNLVASAKRGDERIITTVFGGRSTASRNAKVAELMDLGFRRAPSHASLRRPTRPGYAGHVSTGGGSGDEPPPAGRTVRLVTAVTTSPRPVPRPELPGTAAPPDELIAAIEAEVDTAVAEIVVAEVEATPTAPPAVRPPPPRPETVTLAAATTEGFPEESGPEIVTRVSSSGGHHWGINIGRYASRYQAERVLLKTALNELDTLDEALRKVVDRPDGWHANFVGMSKDQAELACRRLVARNSECTVIGPG